MKPRDHGGVVDEKLNVYGTKHLKIAGIVFLIAILISVDLSICPSQVGANTYSTALLIGEKAVSIIAEELYIAGV